MKAGSFGRGKWVFVDWRGIAPGYGTAWGGAVTDGFCMPEGVELKVHRPTLDLTPVIVRDADKPWEAYGIDNGVFLADGGRFRCWYLTLYPTGEARWRVANRLAYAESDDGVTWRKPVLNLREFNGSKANNLTGVTGAYPSQYGTVFKDPSAPPEARYKMVAPGGKFGLCGAYSADGLMFTSCAEPILPANHTDTDNTAWFNPERGVYSVYTRQAHGNKSQRRAVNRSETADFAHFPPSEPVIDVNPLDPPDWDYYNNAFLPWPGAVDAYLMRLAVYKRNSDTVEMHLAVSRDEKLWYRPEGRAPWIHTGDEFPMRFQSIYSCGGFLPTAAGEWSLYFTLWDMGHNELDARLDRLNPMLVRGRIREDGFMSLSAEGHGQFWTVPFEWRCDRLRLNARTRHSGCVKCEVIEVEKAGVVGASATAGKAAQGFSLDDCDAISGDHIDREVTWKGAADLSRFKGREVQLRFSLFKADLYALKF